MLIRLGDLLVRHGDLTPAQRDQILTAQRDLGRPFGVLAEKMFGVKPEAVERAWAAQYASIAPNIDPRVERVDPDALALVERRQAWQFHVLPMRFVSPEENSLAATDELMVCTTQDSLVRALRFMGWRLGHFCRFVLADPVELGEALMRHYPMAGMKPDDVCATA